MMMEITEYSMRITLLSPSTLYSHYMFYSLHSPDMPAENQIEPVVMKKWVSEVMTYLNEEIHIKLYIFCLVFFKSELFLKIHHC